MNNIIETTIINGKFKGEDVLLAVAMHPPDSNRYSIPIQTFAVSCATRLCNDNQQNTRTITTSVWTEFVKSMLLTWIAVCGLQNLLIYLCTHQKEKQKMLCIQMHFNKYSI